MALFCFMQLRLNTNQNFESPCHFIVGERPLSVKRVIDFLVNKNFHDITFSILVSVFEV